MQKEKIKIKKLSKALEYIRDGKDFNLEIPGGYIFCAGGILVKIKDGNHFFAIDGKWVSAFGGVQ